MLLTRNGSVGGTEVWTQSPLCRDAAAPGTGEHRTDISSLGLLSGAVHVQIHRDLGQAQEQFVTRRQDYFCLDTLSPLLAVALLMPVPVLVPAVPGVCRRVILSLLGEPPSSEHLLPRIQQLA